MYANVYDLKMARHYADMNAEEMEYDGAGFWGRFTAVSSIVAGVLGVASGVALLVTPEPTGVTKIGGVAGIFGGISAIAWGLSYFFD